MDTPDTRFARLSRQSIARLTAGGALGAIVLGFIGGFGVAPAIAVPINPGAPLDGINRTIFMTENDQETLGSLSYQRLSDPAPIVIQPNAQGIFILPFALVSGSVTCCEAPGDANSDTIVLTGQPNGTTFISLFSDPFDQETLPFPDPGDTESVTVSDGGDPVPHTTRFVITSGPEPARIPEPATMTLLGGSLLAFGWLRRRRYEAVRET